MANKKGTRLSLYTKDYVVFDLETTGLSPETDEIIEISGIRVRNGKAVEEFSTLVNPGRAIPYAATRINGITDKMVQDAPALKDALEEFLAFAGEDILVGHNIHTFDMLFLYHGAARVLKRTVPNDYVDTLYLARGAMPGLYRYRLTDLATHFGIDTKGAHRALKDCIMNQQCYECMGKLLMKQQSRNDGKQTSEVKSAREDVICPNCGSILVKRKGKFGEFWGCSAYPKCRYTRNA